MHELFPFVSVRYLNRGFIPSAMNVFRVLVGIGIVIVFISMLGFLLATDDSTDESNPNRTPFADIDQLFTGNVSRSFTDGGKHLTGALLRMSARQATMAAGCRKLRNAPRGHLDEFSLLNHKYRLHYCFVPKTGCTNWRRVFAKLGGRLRNITAVSQDAMHEEVPIPQLQLEQNRRNDVMEGYFRFMFARHPLSRLYSAWLDKFYDTFPNHGYFDSIARRILRRRIMETGYIPTVPEAGFIIGESAQATGVQPNITFPEMCAYMVEEAEAGQALEPHFERQHLLCEPCTLRYHALGHYETMESDARHILSTTGVDHLVQYPQRKSTGYARKRFTMADVSRAVDDLPPALRRRLFQVYKFDFLLFGYSMNWRNGLA